MQAGYRFDPSASGGQTPGLQAILHIVDAIERRPAIVFVILTIVYVVLVAFDIRRYLWFDELNTLYIADQPSLGRMFEAIRSIDFNPPLIYILVRVSRALCGITNLGIRLPSVIAFWAASVALFVLVRRRAGTLIAASAIILLWSGFFFYFATEARPYALVLGFYCSALVFWDNAVHGWYRRLSLAGLGAAATGLMFSHILSPISIFSICVAEGLRWWNTRKADVAVWTVLMLPAVMGAWYIHLIHTFRTVRLVFPLAFQGSVHKILYFYSDALRNDVVPIALSGLFALAVISLNGRNVEYGSQAAEPRLAGRGEQLSSSYHPSVTDLGLLVGALMIPVIINIVFKANRIAFFPRYAISCVAVLYGAIAIGYAYLTRRNALASILLLTSLAMSLIYDRATKPGVPRSSDALSLYVLHQLKTDLPLVAASGLTFLEANHYEVPTLAARLHYLTDYDSAVRYAHATLFELYSLWVKWFPIRGHVTSYQEFTARHRHFLVIGSIEYPEDWLLRKLIAEHASVTRIATIDVPYKDKEIFDVVVPVAELEKQAKASELRARAE